VSAKTWVIVRFLSDGVVENDVHQVATYKECPDLPLLRHLGDKCHPKPLRYDIDSSNRVVVVERLRVCHHGWQMNCSLRTAYPQNMAALSLNDLFINTPGRSAKLGC